MSTDTSRTHSSPEPWAATLDHAPAAQTNIGVRRPPHAWRAVGQRGLQRAANIPQATVPATADECHPAFRDTPSALIKEPEATPFWTITCLAIQPARKLIAECAHPQSSWRAECAMYRVGEIFESPACRWPAVTWVRATACACLMLLLLASGRGLLPGLCANASAAVSERSTKATMAPIAPCCATKPSSKQGPLPHSQFPKAKRCAFCALVCTPCEPLQAPTLPLPCDNTHLDSPPGPISWWASPGVALPSLRAPPIRTCMA